MRGRSKEPAKVPTNQNSWGAHGRWFFENEQDILKFGEMGPFRNEAFISQRAVEAFDKGISVLIPWIRIVKSDAIVFGPFGQNFDPDLVLLIVLVVLPGYQELTEIYGLSGGCCTSASRNRE